MMIILISILMLTLMLIIILTFKKEKYEINKGDLVLEGNGNFYSKNIITDNIYFRNQPVNYDCYLGTDGGDAVNNVKVNTYKNGNIVSYIIYDNQTKFKSGIGYITIQPIINGQISLFDILPENDLFLGFQRLSLTLNPSFDEQLCKVYIGGKYSKNNISGKIIITKIDGSTFNNNDFYLDSMVFTFTV